MKTFGEILAFGAPLLGEALSLIGSWIGAGKEEAAKLEARKQAAMGEMRGARDAETKRHAEENAETWRVIEEAEKALKAPNPTILVDPDETKP